jgi:hypothetical protein
VRRRFRRQYAEPVAALRRLQQACPLKAQGFFHVRRLISRPHLLAPDPDLCRHRDLVARSAGLRARAPSGVTMLELYERQVAETRRMNATLGGWWRSWAWAYRELVGYCPAGEPVTIAPCSSKFSAISDIETFATGSGIRGRLRFGASMDAVGGASGCP